MLEENIQETEAKLGNAVVDNEPKPLFCIEILRLIHDAQNKHGLRHGDFQRYRGYCTRRIGRLRKTLKLPQGDKRHYKKRDVTVAHLDGATGKGAIVGPSGDERFLYVPLMLAERAWAYAMQLRDEANSEPRKKFHLVNKLRRACTYALQMQELCSKSTRLDDKTKLEVEAYVACMHGNLHFQLGLWQSAAEHFQKSQIIYENLIKVIQATSGDEKLCDLYKAKVEELKPNLRYCAYNMNSKSGSVVTIDEVLEIRREQGVSSLIDLESFKAAQIDGAKLETIEWHNHKIQIRLPDKVRVFLLSLQDLDKSIEQAKTLQNKIKIIDSVLIDCRDSIQATKDHFLKSDPTRKSAAGDSASNAPAISNNVQLLLAYLNYIRLIRTVEHNLYVVAQTKQDLSLENTVAEGNDATIKAVRPQNVLRLYENIVQHVCELQQITGCENDKAYQTDMQNLLNTFKAFRCYYIAMTMVSLFRWKEAVALYERAKNYATEALKNPPTQFNLKQELITLLKDIDGCKFSAHAYSVLADDGTTAASNDGLLHLNGSNRKQKTIKSKPLFDRLSHYVEDQQLNSKNPNVFKITPDIEPIPCKPLFFDLALNFVEMPSLDEKIDSPIKKQQQQQQQGVSGFVKSFLGWGGK